MHGEMNKAYMHRTNISVFNITTEHTTSITMPVLVHL